MPRATSSKRPDGSKPYPKPPTFSTAQTNKIAKAFMLALNAIGDDDNDEQTTYSEDEGDGQEEEEEESSTPATLSSSSSDISLLHAALAPLEATRQESLEMLRTLPSYLARFIEQKNQRGIEKTSALLVRHEGIVSETEGKISSLKDSWAAEEHAKQQAAKEAQQRELEKKETAKSKGKATAARIEEDGELAELAAMMSEIPEGELASTPKPIPVLSDLESLDVMLGNASPSSLVQPRTPIKLRFPENRVLPQAFSFAKARVAPRPSPGILSPRATLGAGPPSTSTSTSNIFGEMLLQAPNDFSPSKVMVAPAVKELKKRGRGRPKASTSKTATSPKATSGGTRISQRQKTAHPSYKDEEEDVDGLDSALDQED